MSDRFSGINMYAGNIWTVLCVWKYMMKWMVALVISIIQYKTYMACISTWMQPGLTYKDSSWGSYPRTIVRVPDKDRSQSQVCARMVNEWLLSDL